jgi:O-methyltransferase involved in polyketide biosynthesis
MIPESKDFTSVSPSAKSLLLLKGYTNIPYAKDLAALMQGSEVFELNFDDKDFGFWARVLHFESRYWSIDQLLRQAQTRNILELSSGYSLRGVELCRQDAAIHYIDTDLPDLMAQKQQLVAHQQLHKQLKGQLELLPLNALDENAFQEVVARFEAGPLTIVNEGLLMYLNEAEKQQLCGIIHRILKQRGGYWITADVYVRRGTEALNAIPQSSGEAAFFEQHHIEENKFESYESATAFFREQGLEVVVEATPHPEGLSALPHLMNVLPEAFRNQPQAEGLPKIQATWMLKAI